MRTSTKFRPWGLRLLALGVGLAGCIAANTDEVDLCSGDSQCEEFFGGGSTCEEGYCSEADECEVDEDCFFRFGEQWQCVAEEHACFVDGEAPVRGAQTKAPQGPDTPEQEGHLR